MRVAERRRQLRAEQAKRAHEAAIAAAEAPQERERAAFANRKRTNPNMNLAQAIAEAESNQLRAAEAAAARRRQHQRKLFAASLSSTGGMSEGSDSTEDAAGRSLNSSGNKSDNPPQRWTHQQPYRPMRFGVNPMSANGRHRRLESEDKNASFGKVSPAKSSPGKSYIVISAQAAAHERSRSKVHYRMTRTGTLVLMKHKHQEALPTSSVATLTHLCGKHELRHSAGPGRRFPWR